MRSISAAGLRCAADRRSSSVSSGPCSASHNARARAALAETGIRAEGPCLPASVETGIRAEGPCLPASVETGIRAEGPCLPASVETGIRAEGECPPASVAPTRRARHSSSSTSSGLRTTPGARSHASRSPRPPPSSAASGKVAFSRPSSARPVAVRAKESRRESANGMRWARKTSLSSSAIVSGVRWATAISPGGTPRPSSSRISSATSSSSARSPPPSSSRSASPAGIGVGTSGSKIWRSR